MSLSLGMCLVSDAIDCQTHLPRGMSIAKEEKACLAQLLAASCALLALVDPLDGFALDVHTGSTNASYAAPTKFSCTPPCGRACEHQNVP